MNIELSEDMLDKLADKVAQRALAKIKIACDSDIRGKIINLKEFNKRYVKKSPDWIKQNIFYEFGPDWVENIHPGKGKAFRIHEFAAREWMEEHHNEIDWNAKLPG